MRIYIITLILNANVIIGNMIATILECFSKTTESWKLWINAVTLCDKRSSKSYNLAFVRKNLCACLLEVISSFCLFREVNLGLQRHFSQGQRLH